MTATAIQRQAHEVNERVNSGSVDRDELAAMREELLQQMKEMQKQHRVVTRPNSKETPQVELRRKSDLVDVAKAKVMAMIKKRPSFAADKVLTSTSERASLDALLRENKQLRKRLS